MKADVIKTRKTRRHYCQDITCEVIQDDFNAQGTLIDFTPSALGIKLTGNENINEFDENNPFRNQSDTKWSKTFFRSMPV